MNILKLEHTKCTKLNCNSQRILIYVSAGANLIRLEHVFLKEIHLRVFLTNDLASTSHVRNENFHFHGKSFFPFK